MSLSDKQLTEIRDYYNKNYYVNNDKAHNIDHIDEVYANAITINTNGNYGLSLDILFMASYCHDIFSTIDRKNHHKLARDYVLKASDRYLKLFSKEDLKIIADAVYSHRASGNCEFSTPYSLVISMADKGPPNLHKIMKRSLSYHIEDNDLQVAGEETYKHLLEKFGRNGYAFKCGEYKKVYKDELDIFYKELDLINVKDCINMANSIKYPKC